MHRTLLFCTIVAFGLISSATAGSKARVSSAQERASASGKLIAFVIMQECANGNCPTALTRTGERNGSVKKAVPSKGVVVVKLDPEDLQDPATPECVRAIKSVPCVIVTDADCTRVIDSVGAGVDKARIKEMETKIDSAIKALTGGSATAKSGN